MGELISERIKRNARELKLYGLADTADELVDRAEAGKLLTDTEDGDGGVMVDGDEVVGNDRTT
jgi:hypothetical protein